MRGRKDPWGAAGTRQARPTPRRVGQAARQPVALLALLLVAVALLLAAVQAMVMATAARPEREGVVKARPLLQHTHHHHHPHSHYHHPHSHYHHHLSRPSP